MMRIFGKKVNLSDVSSCSTFPSDLGLICENCDKNSCFHQNLLLIPLVLFIDSFCADLFRFVQFYLDYFWKIWENVITNYINFLNFINFSQKCSVFDAEYLIFVNFKLIWLKKKLKKQKLRKKIGNVDNFLQENNHKFSNTLNFFNVKCTIFIQIAKSIFSRNLFKEERFHLFRKYLNVPRVKYVAQICCSCQGNLPFTYFNSHKCI